MYKQRLQEELDHLNNEIKSLKELDPLLEVFKQEMNELQNRIKDIEQELKKQDDLPKQLVPEENSLIMEIRSEVGGEEAALFAKDLLKMYTKYSENKNWKINLLNLSTTGRGGIKTAILEITGANCGSLLFLEAGVHRVQRVPTTEAKGRIHTSAASVSILPIPSNINLDIPEKDIKMEVCRASGAGGQHVNKTESAVHLIHIPTGIDADCQSDRSQHRNYELALKVLKARLFEFFKNQKQQEYNKIRQKSVATGDRSDKMRTYNFQENRITDHRYNYVVYQLDKILNGQMDDFLHKLLELHKNSMK